MKKILLLEDNISDADLVRREIKNRWPNVELKIVNRLEEARKLMHSKHGFDVAIFDLKLPDGNGMDLLIELRAKKCKTPIIILTGTGSEEIATAALKAGANNYIAKKSGFHKQIPDQIEYAFTFALENYKHLSVLYVEHHQSDIDLTLRYFKKHAPHIQLNFVSTGEEALKLLPENNELLSDYNVLLLDYRLLGLNAIEIAKIVRQERKLSIAIVIVTGQGDENIVVEALKIGVDDYIIKQENYLLKLPYVLTSAFRLKELERSQKILKQSETKFRLLADYAADWEYWINPKGEYVYISPSCELTSGYPPEAFIKNKNLLTEIALPDYQNLITEHFSKEIKKLLKPIEFRILTADGKEKWISHFCRPVYDENNNYAGMRGVNRDITERKEAEVAMRNSEKRYRTYIENAPEGIFVVDSNGKYIDANQTACLMTGYLRKELLKMSIPELISPESPPESLEFFNELKEKGKVEHEAILRKKNGADFHVSLSSVALSNDKFMAFCSDISVRKRDQQIQKILYNISNAVATSENLVEFIALIKNELNTIIDTTNFYIALYEPETNMLSFPFFIDAYDKLISIKAGKSLTSHVIKTKKSLLITKAGLKKLEESGAIERHGTDAEVWLGIPLKIKGKVIGVLAVQSYSDVNAYNELDLKMLEFVSNQLVISIERKKDEENLKVALEQATESDRLKSAFLATMSHELRTPLNAIIGFSDIMDENIPIQDMIGFAKTINTSGNHLLNIVEDIFDITLIETGETRIYKKEVNLQSVLQDVYAVIRAEQQKMDKDHLNLKLKILAKNQDKTIFTDPSKFKQILINLLKNALKFTHNGSVTYGYKIDRENSMLKFYVEDTGIGIHEAKEELIFDAFRQVEETHTKVYGGTGIGLTISKKLVNLLGGEIWLKSTIEKGSTFYFTIPFEKQTVDGKSQKIKLKSKTKTKEKFILKAKNVLIVEDDESSFKFLKIVLQKSGINSLWARNGKEAIKYCKENSDIDLVLMDINMPLMNGYEATKNIKAFRPDLPVMAQTAYAMAGDREKSIEAGCDDYISKPIKQDELMKKIEKLLSL